MIPPQIEIGPVSFHLYGFIIGLAIVTGWYVSKIRSGLYKIRKEIFEDLILLIPLITALIGARLYHVLDYHNAYFENPMAILYIQNGGLGIWGGLIGTFIGLAFICKIRKINLVNVIDLIAPALALGQAIGRVGNYINQEGFGPPSNLPWAVGIDIKNRPLQYINYSRFHPTFFYEAILDLLTFLVLIHLSKKFKKPGQIFAFYLILYSLSRFLVEFARIDTWQISGIKVAQLLSLTALFLGVYIFSKTKSKKT